MNIREILADLVGNGSMTHISFLGELESHRIYLLLCFPRGLQVLPMFSSGDQQVIPETVHGLRSCSYLCCLVE